MKIAFIKTRAANVKSCLIYVFIYSIYLFSHSQNLIQHEQNLLN